MQHFAYNAPSGKVASINVTLVDIQILVTNGQYTRCDISIFLKIKLNLLQTPSVRQVRNPIFIIRRGSRTLSGIKQGPQEVDTAPNIQNIQKRDFWVLDDSCH